MKGRLRLMVPGARSDGGTKASLEYETADNPGRVGVGVGEQRSGCAHRVHNPSLSLFTHKTFAEVLRRSYSNLMRTRLGLLSELLNSRTPGSGCPG